MKNRKLFFYIIIGIQIASILACGSASNSAAEVVEVIERESMIPSDAVKISPVTDINPPLNYSSEYESPVPLPGLVNTAGAEDSPFISPDGNTLYFWFTPDVSIPAEKQILDGVTGIYVSKKVDGEWGKAERIMLQDPGKLAGDGCEFVQNDVMWFCSAREVYTGMHWFTAEFKDGTWKNWEVADFDPDYEVGEFHITKDGFEIYFASERPGGVGGLDIWVSENINGNWQEPINVSAVNTADYEGWPALNIAEDELWFSRNFGVWRSKKVNGVWQEPQLIVSPLAGEPTIDGDGNLYFAHHFFIDNEMIEADIYVAYKKIN